MPLFFCPITYTADTPEDAYLDAVKALVTTEIQQDRVNQATQALKEEKAAAQGQQTTLPTHQPA